MAEKKEEELSRHPGRACRRQRVGGCSRCSDSQWSWFSLSDLYVHDSTSSASYFLRSWPDRWSWADQPRQQGNVLCRKDWIQLRRIAFSEWVMMPVQEVPVYPGCSECEHLRSETCLEERLAKWAHVGWSPLHRCANKIDGCCTGVRTAPCDSEPNTSCGTSTRQGAIAGVCSNLRFRCSPPCRSSLGSLCKSLRLRHRRSPRDVTSLDAIPHLSIDFAPCSVEPMCARSILQRRWVPSRGKSGFPNGVAGRGVASRPLDTHHGRKRYHLGGSCGTARPRRGGARAVALAGRLRGSALADSANGTVSTEHKVATGPRNKQLSTPHHLLSPRLPTQPTNSHF